MTKREIQLAKLNGTIQEIYKILVRKKIRERYDIEDEIALERQKEEKPEEYKAYYNYCEWCKKEVKAELEL